MIDCNYKNISVFLLLVTTIGCKPAGQKEEMLIKFKNVAVNITTGGILNIQNCANWYIDFTRIKRTVVYKEKIICAALNGGFACLNSSDLKEDTSLERKMNTDFFTNISVVQDMDNQWLQFVI